MKQDKWLMNSNSISVLSNFLKLFSDLREIDSEIQKYMIELGIDCPQLQQNISEGKFGNYTSSYLMLRKDKLTDKVNEFISKDQDQINSNLSLLNVIRRSSKPKITKPQVLRKKDLNRRHNF
jgi:DNA integrity scanning protein DisA with diadenylate cyclase activity